MNRSENSCVSQKMMGFIEKSSWIRKMFEQGAILKARHGAENVCDFSLGNPDLAPPASFQESLEKHAADRSPNAHSYMPNAGFPEVRQKVAERVRTDQEVDLEPQHIIMTCGAAGGLNIIFKALLNPGEEVIVPRPYFVEYGFYVDNHQGRLVAVNSKADFHLDLTAIERAIGPSTRAVLINSPNNPTGVIYSDEELDALAGLLLSLSRKIGRAIFLVSDEPYRRLAFSGNTVPPVLAKYPHSMITTSFSKDLSIPGERIGYVAINPEAQDSDALTGAMTLANRILGYVNAPALMQRVTADVLNNSVDVAIYEKRRDLFAEILQDAGLEFIMPRGAFYFFPQSPVQDDTRFVAALQEELILAVPGTGFGSPGFFRLAFCVEDEVIKRSRDGFKRACDKITA